MPVAPSSEEYSMAEMCLNSELLYTRVAGACLLQKKAP